MPGGDRTGPLGLGSKTGRAAGFCTGYNVPGYANPGFGFGFRGGFGRGGGRGWRHRYYVTGLPGWAGGGYGHMPMAEPWSPPLGSRMALHDELKMLRNEAKRCETALGEINARIDELEQERDKTREE